MRSPRRKTQWCSTTFTARRLLRSRPRFLPTQWSRARTGARRPPPGSWRVSSNDLLTLSSVPPTRGRVVADPATNLVRRNRGHLRGLRRHGRLACVSSSWAENDGIRKSRAIGNRMTRGHHVSGTRQGHVASDHLSEAETVGEADCRKTRPAAPLRVWGLDQPGSGAGHRTRGPAASPNPGRDGHFLDATAPCG